MNAMDAVEVIRLVDAGVIKREQGRAILNALVPGTTLGEQVFPKEEEGLTIPIRFDTAPAAASLAEFEKNVTATAKRVADLMARAAERVGPA